jgi:hypothetical protein
LTGNSVNDRDRDTERGACLRRDIRLGWLDVFAAAMVDVVWWTAVGEKLGGR